MTTRDTYTRRDGMRIGLTPAEARVVDILAEYDTLSAGEIALAGDDYRDPPTESAILQAIDVLVAHGIVLLRGGAYRLA